jgi:hypothetical protein
MPMKYDDLHPEYQRIVDALGPPLQRMAFSSDDLAYIAERLPPRLVEFMEYSGKATYMNGAVTICNPREMAPILALVFKADTALSHTDCTAVSYTAFGDFKVWSARHRSVTISLAEGEINSRALAPIRFAPGLLPQPKAAPDPNMSARATIPYHPEFTNFLDYAGEPMLARCLAVHGAPDLGECYGFFPALGLVGPYSPTRSVEHIQRVKALEHFAFLAQVQPFYLTKVGRNGMERIREIG